jgi:putative cardiolipin synthase
MGSIRLAFLGAPALLALVALGALQGCAPLPSLDDRVPSVTIRDSADTRLGRAIVPLVEAHADRSGVVPLLSGRDAFAARMRLADAAERSLDVQYYIWHKDLSGTLLLEALRRAADRGVRVRLLLDDNNTSGLDETLAALDAHANIEVRLFNPFGTRNWRPLGYVFDFARLNRRMHNKSFTADNQATVIGGRNVGDEYFGAGEDFLFVDLDVLAIGPVVDDVSADFDRYWASGSSYPAKDVLPPVGTESTSVVAAAADAAEQSPAAVQYMNALTESPFVRSLLARTLEFEWAAVHMVSDDPAKGLGAVSDDDLLWTRLKRVMKKPERELKLVSAYFVPGAEGVDFFTTMAARGVKVQVLTNSLEATDVVAVHAGYARRRKALLEAGVILFELKRLASNRPVSARDAPRGGVGSSGSSLHAKTFAIDESRIFIGSFNFDPRSARLNTELGFVIDSPALSRSIADSFARHLPDRAYEVRLAPDGTLRWVELRGGTEVVHDQEPGAGFWKRLGVSLLSKLPIEWLL